MGLINNDVPLNEKNQNKNIEAVILPDKEMRDLGFTDWAKDSWYFTDRVGPKEADISFNVSIKKDTGEIDIDVLDEDFCQPYDYQYGLVMGMRGKFALAVHRDVQKLMKKLMDGGVIKGYVIGDYI